MQPPKAIADVLDKPGKYRCDQPAFYWFFEVGEKGRVYQLNPHTMKRDGVLSRDGWNECAATGRVTRLESK